MLNSLSCFVRSRFELSYVLKVLSLWYSCLAIMVQILWWNWDQPIWRRAKLFKKWPLHKPLLMANCGYVDTAIDATSLMRSNRNTQSCGCTSNAVMGRACRDFDYFVWQKPRDIRRSGGSLELQKSWSSSCIKKHMWPLVAAFQRIFILICQATYSTRSPILRDNYWMVIKLISDVYKPGTSLNRNL